MNGKITKLVVSKGKSVAIVKDGPWIKESYTIEQEFPEGCTEETLQEHRLHSIRIIDGWLTDSVELVPTKLDFDVEKFMWKASQWVRKGDTDRVAKPLEDAWIQRSSENEELTNMIKGAPNQKLDFGPYIITFSKDGRFISRKAKKEERQKR